MVSGVSPNIDVHQTFQHVPGAHLHFDGDQEAHLVIR
jgi:hypothetical protein